MRILPIAGVLLLGAHASLAGAAKSRLAHTWWSANPDCYITDLVLDAEGRASLFFQDGRNEGASWMLSGTTLTLRFDRYDDSFTGRFTGSTIRAVHSWRDTDRARTRHTEDCVFMETFGGGI